MPTRQKRVHALMVFACLAVVFFALESEKSHLVSSQMPWQAVGGCGAGGSGGGGGGVATWVGRGITGGLFDLQAMTSMNYGEDFTNKAFNARFSKKLNWKTDVGLSIPIVSKSGNVQYRSNQQDKTQITGGLGDLSADIGYTFGSNGQYSANFSTTIPTGQYDIKRGPDGAKNFLPNSLQKGSGIFSPSFQLGYTKDWDRSMLITNISYSNPVAMRLFSGENEFLSTYYKDIENATGDRFKYRFKSYGENDLGDYFPPSTTLGVTWAYKGTETRVQSIGVNLSIPLGVAWIHSEGEGTYNPRPDPDHKSWSATFQYGYEFSNMDYPVYFAVQLPLSAKKNVVADEYDATGIGKLSGPDWKGFLQTGSIFLGFKSTFF